MCIVLFHIEDFVFVRLHTLAVSCVLFIKFDIKIY